MEDLKVTKSSWCDQGLKAGKINTSGLIPNHCYFPEEFIVLIEFLYIDSNLPKFVLTDPIDDKPQLIQVMAWCQTDNKRLFESVMT